MTTTPTPRLRWKATDGRDQVFLIATPEVLIGRKREADVVIPDQHVSRQHAKVIAVPEGYELIDLSSSYGTFVNNKPVKSHILRDGDKIRFGKGDIEFSYLTGDDNGTDDTDTAMIVQQSLDNLGRVLPAATSDLEKILCVLDFQYQWNQVFTPEGGLDQILESAIKISGAERAFIMTRKEDGFGYANGLDSTGRRLSEFNFRASQSVVRDVVANGRPVFMVEGIQSQFAAQASIVAMNLRAIACIPLRGIPTDGDALEILGILYLDSTKAMHSLSGLDQKILHKLGREAGNVLERVEMIKSIERRKKLESDLALAEETQRSLLPHTLPKLKHLQLHAFSRPTRYVGGDFYNFQVMESGDLIGVLADISGKGVAASLLSSMLLGCLQMLLHSGETLKGALDRVNRFLVEKASGKFATMFLFSIAPNGTGQFISAGHNPAYLYRAAKNDIEELASTSLVLGAFDFATFEARSFELQHGDILFVYSDGLTEAGNPSGDMFGEERLKAVIRSEAPLGIQQLQTAILAAIHQFTKGYEQTDDITIVIAQLASPEEETCLASDLLKTIQ